MSTTTTAKVVDPPVFDPPIAASGQQHSQAWTEYHQQVADQLQNQLTQINALTSQLSTLTGTMGQGVTDGSDAAAGDIGEYLTATSGTVSLANAVLTNIVSIDLTAGDWDVSGTVGFSAGSGTHTLFGAGIGSGLDAVITATFPSAAMSMALPTSVHRYNVTATTTVWLVAEVGFTGSCTAQGIIRARRMR